MSPKFEPNPEAHLPEDVLYAHTLAKYLLTLPEGTVVFAPESGPLDTRPVTEASLKHACKRFGVRTSRITGDYWWREVHEDDSPSVAVALLIF